MKKMLFVYNPHSGKGTAAKRLGEITEIFTKNDYEVTLLPTQHKFHCCDYIKREGHRFDQITVCGGDGMVNEAFNALCSLEGSRPVLGYIPSGTTNDFAASLTLPTDVLKAAQTAAGNNTLEIDAGKFNEKYFCYVAAFGAFTSVAYDTPQKTKNVFGYAAYVLEGIKCMGSIKPYAIKVTTRDNVIEDEVILGLAANSKSVAGIKMKALDVDLSDGLFEVILIKKPEKATDIGAILTDLRSNNAESEYYYAFQTDKLIVNSEEDVAWTLDGEFGGMTTRAEIANIKRAIKIKVAD